jgi:uncharacterized protein
MKLTADHAEGNTITSYRDGEIKIKDTIIRSNLIVSHDTLLPDWQPAAFDELTLSDFDPVLALEPEIILFGTGAQQRFPDIGLMTEILKRGTAFEVMETGAACRTYNVLVGEYRKVVAALLVETAPASR